MNRRYLKLILICLLGLILGIASSVGDILPFGSVFFIVGGFLNTASVWCLSTFFIGTKFRSRKYSILASVLFLNLSVIAYYTFGYLLGNRKEVPLVTLFATSVSWIIIGIFIGALCGLAGRTARFTKDVRKRMIAAVIPMVIIITESIISLIQIFPYLNSNSSNYILFGVLISLLIFAIFLPLIVFRDRRIAFYTLGLSLIVSLTGIIVLIGMSTIQ